MTKPQLWPIFICYRRVDGSAVALRLHEMLDKWQFAGPEGETVQLDVYLDETMPGVEDWKELHRPYLEKARAIIVICTPGTKLNEGPDDWVHQEIDWWLEHRTVAPILIDPLLEGARYVPSQIADRYPDIQRIPLVEEEWLGLTGAALEEKTSAIRRQILGAILPSGAEVYVQELEQERERAQRLRQALAVAVVLLVAALILGGVAYWQRQEAIKNEGIAEAARVEAIENQKIAEASSFDAKAASVLAQASLIDARRDVELTRLRSLKREVDANPGSSVRLSNLLHEISQIKGDLQDMKGERDELLDEGRALLRQADRAWEPLDASDRTRPDPPHILTIELVNAGYGESVLLHYGTPDDIKLVMINGGPTHIFRDFMESRLQEISTNRFDGEPVPIELIIVSEGDSDKAGGVLRLLSKVTDDINSNDASLANIKGIWANIFETSRSFPRQILELIEGLELPLNEPFDYYVLRPDQGISMITMPGGLEVIVLGPTQSQLQALHEWLGRGMSSESAENNGNHIEPLQTETHAAFDTTLEQDALPLPLVDSEPLVNCVPSMNARRQAGGSYRDRHPPNLASMILLFRYEGKTVLFTGDSRGDLILEGLNSTGLMDVEGRVYVDLLTVPFKGSASSNTVDFFNRVHAARYLFSGDSSRYRLPHIGTVAALIDARGCDTYQMYFVDRDIENDRTGEQLDAFFESEQQYNPNYRRIFRSEDDGSVKIDLLDPLRD